MQMFGSDPSFSMDIQNISIQIQITSTMDPLPLRQLEVTKGGSPCIVHLLKCNFADSRISSRQKSQRWSGSLGS